MYLLKPFLKYYPKTSITTLNQIIQMSSRSFLDDLRFIILQTEKHLTVNITSRFSSLKAKIMNQYGFLDWLKDNKKAAVLWLAKLHRNEGPDFWDKVQAEAWSKLN